MRLRSYEISGIGFCFEKEQAKLDREFRQELKDLLWAAEIDNARNSFKESLDSWLVELAAQARVPRPVKHVNVGLLNLNDDDNWDLDLNINDDNERVIFLNCENNDELH